MRRAVRIGTAHGAHFDFATMPAMGTAGDSLEASRADISRRRKIYDRLIARWPPSTPAPSASWTTARSSRPVGSTASTWTACRSAHPTGSTPPPSLPGNAFAGNATEPVAHAFYDWLSPRLWPAILATGTSAGSTGH